MRRPGGAAVLVGAAVVCASACIGDPPPAQLTEQQRRALERNLATTPPAGMQPLDAEFGGRLRLLGFTLAPRRTSFEAGQRIALTLVWQRHGTIEPGWQLFTHLIDDRGAIVANLDRSGPLRSMKGVSGTPLPPAQWPADQVVLDRLDFEAPRTAPTGLRVVAGLFRGRERSAVAGAAADGTNQRASVTKLTVSGKAPAAAIKQLSVPRRPSAATIEIDGALTEPAWSGAADTGRFVHPGTGRAIRPPAVGGRAKLLWDDEFFYVGFEVDDPTVRGGWPSDAIDPHLWTRDTVEIMIDPDGDGDNRDYYEIQVNPQNLVFDSQFDRYNQPRGGADGPFGHQQWSAALQSAVRVEGSIDDDSDRDRGYTVEAKLPWSSFTKARQSPPHPGDRWRMNFYAMQNNGGAAWSPILGRGNFHRASRFGRVLWASR